VPAVQCRGGEVQGFVSTFGSSIVTCRPGCQQQSYCNPEDLASHLVPTSLAQIWQGEFVCFTPLNSANLLSRKNAASRNHSINSSLFILNPPIRKMVELPAVEILRIAQDDIGGGLFDWYAPHWWSPRQQSDVILSDAKDLFPLVCPARSVIGGSEFLCSSCGDVLSRGAIISAWSTNAGADHGH